MPRRSLALAIALVASFSSVRAQDRFTAPDVFKPGRGITNPTVVFEAKPKYTKDALRARIQGVVEVEAIVHTDGRVKDVRILKSLDTEFGLDKEALKAAKAWRFKPAMREGLPVKALVVIQLEFRADSSPADVEFERDAARDDTPGLVPPKVTWEEKPRYTSEAMRQKIQGVALIQVVVGTDGRVARARLLKSLDRSFGLDQEALVAARRWRFEPGTVNGKPVPVLATVALEFRLH